MATFTMNHAPQVASEPKQYSREELDRRLVARKIKDADMARRGELKRQVTERKKGR